MEKSRKIFKHLAVLLFSADFCEIRSLSAGSPVSLLGRTSLWGLTRLMFPQESRRFRKNLLNSTFTINTAKHFIILSQLIFKEYM
jgi:hypothetical protein